MSSDRPTHDGGADSAAPSGERLRSKVPGNQLKLRILLTASRWMVTAGLMGVTFLVLMGLGILDPYGLGRSISRYNTLAWVFQGLLTAIITGVTLVVTINQLVLSQELGPVGDQRERMEQALTFRDDIEEDLDLGTSPPDPATFLRVLVDVTGQRATALTEAVESTQNTTLQEDINAYVETVTTRAEEVSAGLADEQFGTFGVVSAALDFDYSGQIHAGRELQEEHRNALSSEAAHRLDELLSALAWFGPTREHIKTLYFQWELVDLSRTMLYVAVPALIVSLGMLLFGIDGRSLPGRILGVPTLLWVAVGATTVAVSPFMVLISYVLRIGTVAKRTLAIGPFVLRDLNQN